MLCTAGRKIRAPLPLRLANQEASHFQGYRAMVCLGGRLQAESLGRHWRGQVVPFQRSGKDNFHDIQQIRLVYFQTKEMGRTNSCLLSQRER